MWPLAPVGRARCLPCSINACCERRYGHSVTMQLPEEPEVRGSGGLESLKALALKLKLQTRRPSYLEWKERLQSRTWAERGEDCVCGFTCMGEALDWLRKELRAMQLQDNRLARQLMQLRVEIQRMKVEQVCHQHKEMIDDASLELEECGEDPDLLWDIPLKAAFALSTPLKHLGLTRMNINSRRFSLC